MTLTHKNLVFYGKKWLLKHYCSVVITELSTIAFEEPDIVGFDNYGNIYQIECKVSVQDFKKNKEKFFMDKEEKGIGDYRYFFVPEKIVEKILPFMPQKWGLLTINNKNKIEIVIKAQQQKHNYKKALSIMVSAFRRLWIKDVVGLSIKIYNYVNENPRATLNILREKNIMKLFKIDLMEFTTELNNASVEELKDLRQNFVSIINMIDEAIKNKMQKNNQKLFEGK